jgi:CDP-2,3-bis-(O-geranylgeranyl)-sn-glycerol synthase
MPRLRPFCAPTATFHWLAVDPVHPWPILQLLILLILANGTPVVAKKILGERFAYPLDGGVEFVDGRPLFGRSKTVRGVVLAVLVTMAGAPVVGLEWVIGVLVGSLAMAGDLFSSFLKRRMALPPSSRASGLDQVPEALFPLFACRNLLSLTMADIGAAAALFFIGEVLLSRVLYAFRLRDRPY